MSEEIPPVSDAVLESLPPVEEGQEAAEHEDGGEGQEAAPKAEEDAVEALPTLLEEPVEEKKPEREQPILYKEESYKKYEVTNKYTFAEFELSEFADSFALFDIMGEGNLTVPQMWRAMFMSGYEEEEIHVKRAINDVDPEGNGLFSFQAFVDVMSHFRRPPLTEVELRETFEFMDKDKGGSVDAAELKQLLMSLGHALTADEAYAMIDEADKDGSGEVEFDEFSHIILSTQA